MCSMAKMLLTILNKSDASKMSQSRMLNRQNSPYTQIPSIHLLMGQVLYGLCQQKATLILISLCLGELIQSF